MEVGGWKTTFVFQRCAIVDNQGIADAMVCHAMDMLKRSQDEQRQRLEVGLVAEAVASDVASLQSGHQRETPAGRPHCPSQRCYRRSQPSRQRLSCRSLNLYPSRVPNSEPGLAVACSWFGTSQTSKHPPIAFVVADDLAMFRSHAAWLRDESMSQWATFVVPLWIAPSMRLTEPNRRDG
jgi:hypothetical protein